MSIFFDLWVIFLFFLWDKFSSSVFAFNIASMQFFERPLRFTYVKFVFLIFDFYNDVVFLPFIHILK